MRRGANPSGSCRAYLIVEVLMSLTIAFAAFTSFLSIYQAARRQQQRLQQESAAVLLLHTRMQEVRGGLLAEAFEPGNWSSREDGGLMYPSAPAPWTGEGADRGFVWQLTAPARPVSGGLFEFTARISWQQDGRRRSVSATTELWIP
jgi:type II secretory pathway pseudopilin PulG